MVASSPGDGRETWEREKDRESDRKEKAEAEAFRGSSIRITSNRILQRAPLTFGNKILLTKCWGKTVVNHHLGLLGLSQDKWTNRVKM